MKKLFFGFLLLILISSCTGNQRARTFGGTEEVKLLPNEKFINVAWKDTDLWVVTQDTLTKVYYAREKSSFGVMQGTIIIKK